MMLAASVLNSWEPIRRPSGLPWVICRTRSSAAFTAAAGAPKELPVEYTRYANRILASWQSVSTLVSFARRWRVVCVMPLSYKPHRQGQQQSGVNPELFFRSVQWCSDVYLYRRVCTRSPTPPLIGNSLWWVVCITFLYKEKYILTLQEIYGILALSRPFTKAW